MGLPNYVNYDNQLVIIIAQEHRKQNGKGTATQCYYTMENGKQKHASFFGRLTQEQIKKLSRNTKIEQIFNDD